MNSCTVLRGASAFAFTLLLSATAQAQLFRAYLAPTGVDTNPCTLPAPCRLLPAALNAVASGGEIWMLDSANYNTATVNVTKSVTILAVPGAVGSVLATGGDAINIATAGVKVALRNLVIVPFPGGGGANGIVMTDGAALTVENCLIANMPQSGVVVNTAASVRVTDSTIRGNGVYGVAILNGASAVITRATIGGQSGAYGVHVAGTIASTVTSADVGDSTVDGNLIGVNVFAAATGTVVKASVHGSRVVRNSNSGVLSSTGATGASASVSVNSSVISNNLYGLVALGAGSKMWASANSVSDNDLGLGDFGGGALFESAGNNAVRNNSGGDTAGTITVIATK